MTDDRCRSDMTGVLSQYDEETTLSMVACRGKDACRRATLRADDDRAVGPYGHESRTVPGDPMEVGQVTLNFVFLT